MPARSSNSAESSVAHLNGAGEQEATFAIDVGEGAPISQAEAAAELAFGAQLRSYRFDKYKTKQKPEQKPSLVEPDRSDDRHADAAERAYQPLEKTAEAVFFTRDLVSEPPNVIYPETLAAEAERTRRIRRRRSKSSTSTRCASSG